MKTKFGLVAMDNIEYNVLQVALDHMLEHLNEVIDDAEQDEISITQERIDACKRLINSIK